MMRAAALVAGAFLSIAGLAQFPFLRTLEVRPGQQRPAITCLAQDGLGLLWTGSDIGLFRTDGERVDVILRTEGIPITALCSDGHSMFAALGNGVVLRCTSDRCDTVLHDPDLAGSPVRAMVLRPDGTLCLGTYGSGVWLRSTHGLVKLGAAMGMPDDHVNDLVLLPDGRLAVATDQGLAICSGERVVEVFDEAHGAPDNLILALDFANGVVQAGTDRRGVFKWVPGSITATVLDSAWSHGPVTSIVAHEDMIWVGTEKAGVVLFDTRSVHTSYRQHGSRDGGIPGMGLLVDLEGAVWWCDGTDRLHRADPAILFVPEHEGLDLRTITAICTDDRDRIWFATADGLFHHAAAFSEELNVTRIPVTVDPRTPIVSLSADASGTVWAATFGSGVLAIDPRDRPAHFTRKDGLSNDNVLSVRAAGNAVWFATLEGLTVWRDGGFRPVAKEAGFTFDLLPLNDTTLWMATDGMGVLRWDGQLSAPLSAGPRTYYSLVRDGRGAVWAAGPGTGLCDIAKDRMRCMGSGRPPFDGDLFALGASQGRIIAFGSTGTVALDPVTGAWTDLSSRLGLEEFQAQLNVIASDADGDLWMGCDKGLVRLRLNEHHFDPNVPVIITDVLVNGEVKPVAQEFRTTHDRNDVTIRFTGLHYTDPGALRFEYRLDDGLVQRTRDREVVLAGLAPGRHRFLIRAFVGEPGGTEDWRTLTVVVSPPWWRLPWVIGLLVVSVVLLLYWMITTRERRIRFRDRLEQEKVRFQLQALRSQVDPHFLFNSFNTLIDLIETDREKAVAHVDQLSTFFRNILLVRDQDLITVGEELQLLATYFALEQHRFGAAIDLRIDVPEGHRSAGIVPMTLQLLVENALKHNIATVHAPLIITIHVEQDELVVMNPARPRLTPPRSTGFGLDSIVKRYAAITDRPIRVEQANDRFVVRIPLISSKP